MGRGVGYSYKHLILVPEDLHQMYSGEHEIVVDFDGVLTQMQKDTIRAAVGVDMDEVRPGVLSYSASDMTVLDGVAAKMKTWVETNEEFFPDIRIEESDKEWDENAWEEFKSEVCECFGAEEISPVRHTGNDSYIFGETDHFEIGCDSSGAVACVYVEPKSYEDDSDIVEYDIDRRVIKGFNRLLDNYAPETFRKPSGAYSSHGLTTYTT